MAESIESVFTPAKKSRSSRRPIVVPQWLRRSGEQWNRIPNVESVLLFGSRATGHAVPSSDWDVAVLHTGTESPRIPCVSKHYVEIACLSVDRYCREAHLVGSLAHELALHAMLIAGRDNYRIQKELGTSYDDLKRHLRGVFRELGTSFGYLHAVWMSIARSCDFESEYADYAGKPSGDGAEFVAKALCVHLGISYEHRHSVAQLSQHVPDAWKDKVLSMDGDTHATHEAGYTEYAETCGTVLGRIDNSLRLFSEFLIPCLEHMSKESIRALARELEFREMQATKNLDSLRATEDIHPRIRDLLRRFDANMELIIERNRSLDRSHGMEDDLEP